MSETTGLRARKKAATRKHISDTATMLFLERGFDQVSVREVAEAAEVSATTVFSYFPRKESLVFDEDDDQRELLVASVRDRDAGVPILDAIRDYFLAEISHMQEHEDGSIRRFLAFIDATPALADYSQKMWLRHEDALIDAIAADLGQAEPSADVRAVARFVLQTQLLALAAVDPAATIRAAFGILENGWSPQR